MRGEKSIMNLVLLPVKVHLDGVIDDQVSRADRVNLLWVSAEFHHGVTHGSKVHHSRNSTARRDEEKGVVT